MIVLKMHPQDAPLSWEEFVNTKEPYSIALDGYVADGPCLDRQRKYVNFNHHEGCYRPATRATCAQTLIAVRTGLFKRLLRKDNVPHALVWANDCDEDVCLAWYILKNAHSTESLIHPMLNRLVDVADKMDTAGGMWHLSPDTPILRQLAWIMQPYRSFRASGGLERRDPLAFSSVVEDVGRRIEHHLVGQGGEIALDTRYNVIRAGHGWSMIEEIGTYGRQGALADGIHAFLTVRPRSDGRWDYVIGQSSDYDHFDTPRYIAMANEIEAPPARWGCGTTIGGSDRAQGSAIAPAVLFDMIEPEMIRAA